MAQPTPYVPATDFTDLPDEQIKTKLDIEFPAIATSIQELCTNIGLIQRDDGALVNGIVTVDSLSQAVLNLFAIEQLTVRGAWVTLTVYAKGDVVTQASGTYVAAVAHTSGTFATDLSNGKWVLLASTAASTAASYTVTGAVAPAEGIYKPAASTLGLSAGGLDVMRLVGVGSAVNYFTVTNSATGNTLEIAASGSDTNISLTLTPKGSGKVLTNSSGFNGYMFNGTNGSRTNGFGLNVGEAPQIIANGGICLQFHTPSPGAWNWWQMKGAATGFYPTLQTAGSDTNVGMVFQSKGAIGIVFNTGGDGTGNSYAAGVTQLVVDHVASSVNWWSLRGAAAAGDIVAIAQGSSTDIGIRYQTKGTGSHTFYSNAGGQAQFSITHTASAVNMLRTSGSAAGSGVTLWCTGSDTDIAMILSSKGAGVVDLCTRLTGSGGVRQLQVRDDTSSASVNYIFVQGAQAGNTSKIGVDGSSTNPGILFIGKGTGGLTFNLGSTGGANNGVVHFQITGSSSVVNWVNLAGGLTGAPPIFSVNGETNVDITISPAGTGKLNTKGINVTASNIPLTGIYLDSGGSALAFSSNTKLALQLAANASAVNNILLDATATGVDIHFGCNGSDTNNGIQFYSRGTGAIGFYSHSLGALQAKVLATASAVNYLTLTGAVASGHPVLAVDGSDTNINLILTPKGTGVLKLGNSASMTANATATVTISNLAPAAVTTATIKEWLTIQRSDGTVRYIPTWGA